MVRTRIREDQSNDTDFLSEQEGYGTFLLKNDINDGYTIFDDGYKVYYKDSLDQLHPLSPLSISVGDSYHYDISEINFSEAYGFTIASASDGRVEIGFESQFASQAEVASYSYWSQDSYNAVNADLATLASSTPQATYVPIVKFGNVIQTPTFAYGYYVKNGVLITIVINIYIAQKSSDIGKVTISLPFQSKNINYFRQHLSVSGINIGAYTGQTVYGIPVYGLDEYNASISQDGKPLEALIDPGKTELSFQRLGYTEDGILSAALPQTVKINISGNYVIEQ